MVFSLDVRAGRRLSYFALRDGRVSRYGYGWSIVDGRQTMSVARPFHVVMVFAAFLFVGAIVMGLI
jgi:hypothetical protein